MKALGRFAQLRRLWTPPDKSGLMPRSLAREAQAPWPKCAVCMRNVDAYGIENDTPASLEVWVRCDGIRDGEERKHEAKRAGFRIDKRRYVLGLSENEFRDIVSRLTLRPGSIGTWVLDRRGAPADNIREA